MQKWTLSAIKKANAAAGFFYWEPGKDRVCRTHTLPYVYQGPGGVYLVESVGLCNGLPCLAARVLRFDPVTGKIARSPLYHDNAVTLGAFRPNHIRDARKIASLCASEGAARNVFTE